MEIDLNKYANNRTPVQNWYRDCNYDNISLAISIWAGGTMCPCICLAFYLAEDMGYTPELIRLINIFIKEYRYEKIHGQKSDSPFLHYDPAHDIID
jgi:hypothetical protein